MSQPTADPAQLLHDLVNSLELGGFTMDIQRAAPHDLDLTVVPGPDACAECLIPMPVMRTVVADLLGDSGWSVRAIIYPSEE